MALTDIQSYDGVAGIFDFSRGNGGVVSEIVSALKNAFEIPSALDSAVFPSEDDVDNGVTYGPTGADNAGNLQQPAQGNVRIGVGYGASGSEFTGTLDPGAGGGTTFISIVNE